MSQTDYNAGWRNKRAADADQAEFDSADEQRAARNYDVICNDDSIGAAAAAGLKLAIKEDYPRMEVTCRSSDVAARFLAIVKGNALNNTAVAKAIVGDDKGDDLINVYLDHDPLFSETTAKTVLKIGTDWICPFVELSPDGKLLTVGYPKRNSAGQTVGIEPTGSIALE